MVKTKKYYRDTINSSYDAAYSVLGEVLDKYGDIPYRSQREAIFENVSNNRNGEIRGFLYNKKLKQISARIYWQGDSTDGDDYAVIDKTGVILPAETFYDGRRTIEEHGDIMFGKEELYQAIKNLASTYLK